MIQMTRKQGLIAYALACLMVASALTGCSTQRASSGAPAAIAEIGSPTGPSPPSTCSLARVGLLTLDTIADLNELAARSGERD